MANQQVTRCDSVNRSLAWLILNDKTSIRYQLLASFGTVTFVAGGITLAICYGVLYGLAKSTSTSTTSVLVGQTEASLLTTATEIANTVSQELAVIGQSVAMVGALYSQLLIQQIVATTAIPPVNETVLISQRSFKEYNFVAGCTYPNCPKDYGSFNGELDRVESVGLG
jgi:hypothetical protein